MDNRDMFYNSYGYSSGYPMNQMFPQNMMQQPNIIFPNQNNPTMDIENRLNRIEKQITRLNQRVTRLESPNNSNIYTEPDNNLYML